MLVESMFLATVGCTTLKTKNLLPRSACPSNTLLNTCRSVCPDVAGRVETGRGGGGVREVEQRLQQKRKFKIKGHNVEADMCRLKVTWCQDSYKDIVEAHCCGI